MCTLPWSEATHKSCGCVPAGVNERLQMAAADVPRLQPKGRGMAVKYQVHILYINYTLYINYIYIYIYIYILYIYIYTYHGVICIAAPPDLQQPQSLQDARSTIQRQHDTSPRDEAWHANIIYNILHTYSWGFMYRCTTKHAAATELTRCQKHSTGAI